MINDLTLNNFRCFSSLKIKLSPGINFFYGKNGSGKTSILEAINLCSSAKSFKSGNLQSLISIGEEAFNIKGFDNTSGYSLTITKEKTVFDAKSLMREYGIGGIPVIDNLGKLRGIVTNRDLRFEHNNDRAIVEVMTEKNLITAPVGTSLKDAESILQLNKIEKLLIVDDEYKLCGLITFRDITKVTQKPIANKDSFGRLRVAAALGVTGDAVDRAEALVNAGVDAIIIDTAHGHTQGVVKVLKEVKAKFPKLDVIVGNIATPEAAKYLVENGADGVKVGIGPGSICTTRIVAGVGFPQFSAVLEVAMPMVVECSRLIISLSTSGTTLCQIKKAF